MAVTMDQTYYVGMQSAWDTALGVSNVEYAIDDYGNVYDWNTGSQMTTTAVLSNMIGNAMVSTTPTPDWLTALTSLANVAPSLIAGLTSYQVSQINVQRAQKGLPPISTASVAPAINAGLTPETQRMIMMIAVGLGAVLLLRGRAK